VIVTDYERHNIDIACYCGGSGDCGWRCVVCKVCRRRIKGIWWVEHSNAGCKK
jgi:hypothetical protein